MAHRHDADRGQGDTDRGGDGRTWLPPVPIEHGARSLLAVAVLTPVAVVLGQSAPGLRAALGYVVFVLFAVVGLFFREAVRRRLASPPSHRSRYTAFAAVEAAVLLVSAGTLVWLDGPAWALLVLVVPGVVVEVWVRNRGWPLGLGDELSGVLALSLVVPVGASLLGVGGLQTGAVLFALFVAFHVGSVVRVKTALRRNGEGYWRTLALDVATHGLLATAGVAGWLAGLLGGGGPVLFLGSAARAAWLAGRSERPDVRALGRGERAFSLAVLLVGPWLLP